jgi:AcrR family transcriptional regulator
MADNPLQSRKPRPVSSRKPLQQRSRQKREEILLATGALLEQVGFDDLTTVLIARELKISVGSVYHYFPNKHAILYAMAEHWLDEYSLALDAIAAQDLENFELPAFSELAVGRLLQVYREQKGMLPLVQAICAVPELYELDAAHDDMVVTRMTEMYQRLGLVQGKAELQRRGLLWLEMTHALLLSICSQPKARAKRSITDLVSLSSALLELP